MSGVIPTLTPAYGRDYKSEEQVLKSFNDGKDFTYNDISSPYDGKYCSIRDFKPGQRLKFRYDKLAESFYHDIPKPK